MYCFTSLIRHAFLFVLTLFLLVGCAHSQESAQEQRLERYQFMQLHMGMEVRLVMYAGTESLAQQASQAGFNRIDELNRIFSHYDPNSELSQLNEQAGGPPVSVSDELFTVLEYALRLAEKTEGAFDVTVGPLMDLWRASGERNMLPHQDELQQTRARVGWTKIHLDADKQTVQLQQPGMELDLGGIAKGYILGQAMNVLLEHRITRSLAEAGGDLVVSNAPPDQEGWRILIPYYPERDTAHTITVADAAISTSGDTEQAIQIDGVRYSHVIDPRTGLGMTNQVMATVVAPQGMQADGLSTAVSILGDEEGTELLKRYSDVDFYLRPSPWVNNTPESDD